MMRDSSALPSQSAVGPKRLECLLAIVPGVPLEWLTANSRVLSRKVDFSKARGVCSLLTHPLHRSLKKICLNFKPLSQGRWDFSFHMLHQKIFSNSRNISSLQIHSKKLNKLWDTILWVVIEIEVILPFNGEKLLGFLSSFNGCLTVMQSDGIDGGREDYSNSEGLSTMYIVQ